jgi:predicted negative regulator of RcsB-dependent stress response
MNRQVLHWTSWRKRWQDNYVKGSFVDELLSEKEQIDQMRAWWSEYGAYVIGGIVIGAGLLFGINHYQNTRLQAQLDASTAYEKLIVLVVDGKLEDAEVVADEIATSYGDTTYAGQTGLAMARLYMDKNRDQDAADALLGVVNSDADDELKDVARLRLARIYLYQDKAQEVVDLLAGNDAGAFTSAFGEVLGDAYTALGRIAEAQDAYQKVLSDPASQITIDRQIVQWKSLDLPEVTAEEAEPAPAAAVEADEADSEEGE